MKTSLINHWEDAYQNKATEELGWYEQESTPSINLIQSCQLPLDAHILNVGAGSSTLTDSLVQLGYQNITHHDLSQKALAITQSRLNHTDAVNYVQDDLTNPNQLNAIAPVDLWHDRAVLHFFTEANDQQTYFDLLRSTLKKGGFAIIATFHADGGAEKCCGLSLQRYNLDLLSKNLGDAFQLVQTFNYVYTNPAGHPRKYIYTLWKYN